jgi:hypothetical protein
MKLNEKIRNIVKSYIKDNKFLLNEKLVNIDDDVDSLYNKYFKFDIDEISKTGIITKQMFKRFETTTDILKTEEAIKANEINHCKIIINQDIQSSNYYNPFERIISISINKNAFDFVIDDFNGNLNKANENLEGTDLYGVLLNEFSEHKIKGSIHHELSHWIDDTINKKHIIKRLEKQIKIGTRDINNIPINATKMELQAQIHNIKQFYNQHKNEYNELTLIDLFKKIPTLHTIFKSLKSPYREQWLKDLIKRMNREGLLGKKMRLNNLILEKTIRKIIQEALKILKK